MFVSVCWGSLVGPSGLPGRGPSREAGGVVVLIDQNESGGRRPFWGAGGLVTRISAHFLVTVFEESHQIREGGMLRHCRVSDKQIDRRHVKQLSGGGSSAAAVQVRSQLAPMALSELEPQPVTWLWPKRIPLGAITVVAGEPGLGKSLLTLNLAARLSRGDLGEFGNSLLLTAEDDREQTLVPRLIASGADRSRTFVPPRVKGELDLPPRIPSDMGEIRRLAIAGDVRLLIIDPLSAHLEGSVDGNSDKSVRAALTPLARLAEERNLAVVLVAHLNKGESANALRRIGGSIALPAAARSVLLLTRDPDDPDGVDGSLRVLAHAKSNLSRLQPSIAYRLEELTVPTLDEPIAMMRELGRSPYSAEQLLALDQQEARSKLEEARALLLSELAEGLKPARDLEAAAQQIGISPTTLARAKRQLNVKSIKRGFDRWDWQLPDSDRALKPLAEDVELVEAA